MAARNRNKFKLSLIVLLAVLAAASAAAIKLNRTDSPIKDGLTQSSDTGSNDTDGSRPSGTEPSQGQQPSQSDTTYTLLIENEQYAIRRASTGSYLITLYVIINNPSQRDQYHDQLREYKRNALDYLKSQGVDVTKADIKYEPPEAADL